MTAHCLNVVGLVLNMAGVVLAFFFGFPQSDLSEGIAVGLVQTAEHDQKQRALKARYRRRAYVALWFMFAGFAAQLWALLIP